jgi:hypothetical protein
MMMAQTGVQSCVAACRDCLNACEACIGQEVGNGQMVDCLRQCLDCIEICRGCIRAMLRNSRFAAKWCAFYAGI